MIECTVLFKVKLEVCPGRIYSSNMSLKINGLVVSHTAPLCDINIRPDVSEVLLCGPEVKQVLRI